MTRKERRAALKEARKHAVLGMAAASEIDRLGKAALRYHGLGELAAAENCCRQILAYDPSHVASLNMLGSIAYEAGRNNEAVRLLNRALSIDVTNAACHDNIGLAYQALGRHDEAYAHFGKALALGLEDEPSLATRGPAVHACVAHFTQAWPRQLALDRLFQPAGLVALANDAMLECVLRTRFVRDVELERFLTAVRAALLDAADEAAPLDENELRFFCALAQQCFINEYVFATDAKERERADKFRQSLIDALRGGACVEARTLIAVGCYFPLYALPNAQSLLLRDWPATVQELLRRHVREPLEEQDDRPSIPILTPIEDTVSVQVKQQYEENPYPRWISLAPTVRMATLAYLRQHLHAEPILDGPSNPESDILIAGCGTGSHPIVTAQRCPDARILAVDLSTASLAYARRKTREAGIGNITYGQADILKLDSLGRSFDLIESIGVLHHVADPIAGWRVLLSALRSGGLMRIGLYSEIARRFVVTARKMIAERGHRSTAEDIRTCRQELIGCADIPNCPDLFSLSGCRDLFFHVMEHRFSIPEIKAFVTENNLRFLGFELELSRIEQFRRRFPASAAERDLDNWHVYEHENPKIFMAMYRFWVQKPH